MKIRNYNSSDYLAVKEILESGKLFYEVCDSESNLVRVIQQEPNSILEPIRLGNLIL